MNKIRYAGIRARGGRLPQLHLSVMKALTTIIAPWGRIKGLGLAAGLCRLILKGESAYTQVELNSTTKFSYPTYDSYWAYFIHSNRLYEQGLVLFLAKIAAHRFCFIDCGANYGWWPAIMSSDEFHAHQCLAVECSPQTFALLKKNASLNGERFQCIQKAVYSNSDTAIRFAEGGRHAGRHIINGNIEQLNVNTKGILAPAEYETLVNTITLDQMIHDFFPQEDSFVVKMDIEGAEIDGIRGAGELIKKNVIFIYEDFGGDKESKVTEHFLQEDFQVYYPDEYGNTRHIPGLQELESIKKDRRMGYNLIAVKRHSRFAKEIF